MQKGGLGLALGAARRPRLLPKGSALGRHAHFTCAMMNPDSLMLS